MKLIERILDKSNVREAINKVIANKGAPGIDGMAGEELRDYMNANWASIKESILAREYRPKPVRRVEIPKASLGYRAWLTEYSNNPLFKSSRQSLRQSSKRTAMASAHAEAVSKRY